jgi:hypothetical protein
MMGKLEIQAAANPLRDMRVNVVVQREKAIPVRRRGVGLREDIHEDGPLVIFRFLDSSKESVRQR